MNRAPMIAVAACAICLLPGCQTPASSEIAEPVATPYVPQRDAPNDPESLCMTLGQVAAAAYEARRNGVPLNRLIDQATEGLTGRDRTLVSNVVTLGYSAPSPSRAYMDVDNACRRGIAQRGAAPNPGPRQGRPTSNQPL